MQMDQMTMCFSQGRTTSLRLKVWEGIASGRSRYYKEGRTIFVNSCLSFSKQITAEITVCIAY